MPNKRSDAPSPKPKKAKPLKCNHGYRVTDCDMCKHHISKPEMFFHCGCFTDTGVLCPECECVKNSPKAKRRIDSVEPRAEDAELYRRLAIEELLHDMGETEAWSNGEYIKGVSSWILSLAEDIYDAGWRKPVASREDK